MSLRAFLLWIVSLLVLVIVVFQSISADVAKPVFTFDGR